MKHIRIITMIFSLVVTLFITAQPAFAAEDMMDNLFPQSDQKKEGNVELEYNKYPMSRYGMDTQIKESEMKDFLPWGWDEGVGKEKNQLLSMVNSTLWGFNKITYMLVGVLVDESFTFDVIDKVSTSIADAVQSLAGFGPGGFKSKGLWPYLIEIVIVFMAVWAAYTYVIKKASSHALSGILSSLFILVVAFGFFTNADKLLTGINSITTEVQNDVLSNSLTVTTPGQYNEREGMASVRNQIFNLMIKYPYLLLEYGTTDEDKIESEWKKDGSRQDAILKTKIFSQERQDAIKYEVEEMKNDNMKPQALTDRGTILTLVLIMNLVMGGTLLLLSGSLIVYQVMALVFTLFTPFAFLIGVIPVFSNTARSVIMKVLHAFYMKIALGAIMMILFTISSMIYNTMNPKEGYVLLFLIQIVCYVTVWKKKGEILNIITTPFRKSNVNNSAGQSIQEYKQSYFQGKKYLKTAAKPFTAKAAPLVERFNKIKYNPGVGVVNAINHPNFAPKNDKAPAATKTESNRKPFSRKNTKPAETTQKPPVPEPTDRDRDFENLQETANPGGWAHRKKEEVKIKPELKDRLKDRKAKKNGSDNK